MSHQLTCCRGCIITLVAFFWLFSTVCFQMCPQMACLRRCIVALVAFLHHVFSNESSNHLPERKHSCIGCICGASPHYESANAFWYGLHVWMNSYTGSSCGIHPSSHTWFENFPSPFLKSKEDLRIVLHRLTPFPWMRQWKNAFKERRPQKGKVFPFPTNLSAQNIYIPKW